MTRTSNVPLTSKVAYHMIGELKSNHHAKILMAMKLLAVPSGMQKIAEKADLPYISVARRMSELELDGLIEKAGKGLTETNRPCSLYKLIHISPLLEVKEPEPRGNEVQLSIF